MGFHFCGVRTAYREGGGRSGGSHVFCRSHGYVPGLLRKIRQPDQSGEIYGRQHSLLHNQLLSDLPLPLAGTQPVGLRAVRIFRGHSVAGLLQHGGKNYAQGRHHALCHAGAGRRSGMLRRPYLRGNGFIRRRRQTSDRHPDGSDFPGGHAGRVRRSGCAEQALQDCMMRETPVRRVIKIFRGMLQNEIFLQHSPFYGKRWKTGFIPSKVQNCSNPISFNSSMVSLIKAPRCSFLWLSLPMVRTVPPSSL